MSGFYKPYYFPFDLQYIENIVYIFASFEIQWCIYTIYSTLIVEARSDEIRSGCTFFIVRCKETLKASHFAPAEWKEDSLDWLDCGVMLHESMLTRMPTRLKVAPISKEKLIATIRCVSFSTSTNLRRQKCFENLVMNFVVSSTHTTVFIVCDLIPLILTARSFNYL